MDIKLKSLAEAKLPRKFMILGGLALFLVAVPFYQYFAASQKVVAAAQREAAGAEPAKLIIDIITLTQQHRGLAAGALAGNQQLASELGPKKEEADRAIAKLDAALANVDNSDLTAAWSKSRQEWSKLAANVASRSINGQASFANHTSLIADYLGELDMMLDHYGLSLDSNATNYPLIQASYVTIPALNEAFGQLRALGTGQLTSAAQRRAAGTEGAYDIPLAERTRIATALAAAQNALGATTLNLNKAFKTSEAAKSLQVPLKTSSDAAQHFLETARKEVAESQSLTMVPADYFDLATATIGEQLKLSDASNESLTRQLDDTVSNLRFQQIAIALVIVALSIVGLLLAIFIMRTITGPINHLQGVMEKLRQGDTTVRAQLTSPDEIGTLARQFDQMVDEREAVAEKIKRENDRLNDSILTLLQGVAKLAQRDLTSKVPVAEDVTGAVSDALNLLSTETAKVLKQVTDISADVTGASLKVKQQSDTVLATSDAERRQIEMTTEDLRNAAQAMERIGQLANTANTVADNAIKTTQAALSTVNATVGGINNTRDTIRETEKRIKRLGERSQEISGVVGLINTIAERTHILALNASMHAASAGEAGRGFAVVAEEVQRLAENARQATAQIATLVNNIQVETVDTVNTMNTAISQVVDGSRLAEQAGEQMKLTQQATSELVDSVRQIAVNTQEQATLSSGLLVRAEDIRKSSEHTSRELSEQASQTENLVEYSKALLGAVRVFKLPA